jgi:rod shape determining protein RodA
VRLGGGGELTTLAPPKGRAARLAPKERLRALAADLDWILLAAVIATTALSLFVLKEATGDDIPGSPNYFFFRQILFISLGVVVMLIAAGWDTANLSRWIWPIFWTLLVALAVVFVLGRAAGGATRWVDLGPLSLQPSEMGKIGIALVLVGVAVERRGMLSPTAFTLTMVGVTAVPMFVIALQPDLGTGIVYGVILAAVLFLAGAPWSHLATGAAILVILATAVLWILPAAGVNVLADYQRERLTAFVGSERDTSDQGYQLDQSTTAIGSGGALGKGPSGATQTQNDFLPEHHTDFIFAVTAEMLGFVGGAGLILLYGLIIWRGLRVTAQASTPTDQLLAGAIVAVLAFQVFVNIGMTVRLMPITGIPLPLMSYGGSHTITTFAAVGLLLGIHRRRSHLTA